jgi:hypothetical protein
MIDGFKIPKVPLPRGWKIGDWASRTKNANLGLVVDFDRHTLTVDYEDGSSIRLPILLWRKAQKV